MGSGPQEASRTDARVTEHRQQALTLRIQGGSYREIATALGISVGSAYVYVTESLAELRELTTETAKQLREIELHRLDELYLKLSVKLQSQVVEVVDAATGQRSRRASPDETTVRAMLDVSRRRAELLGLDAPRKTELGGPDGGAIPIAASIVDARSVLLRRLSEMSARTAAVLVPTEATQLSEAPEGASPLLALSAEQHAAPEADPAASAVVIADVSHTNGANGNGSNGHHP